MSRCAMPENVLCMDRTLPPQAHSRLESRSDNLKQAAQNPGVAFDIDLF